MAACPFPDRAHRGLGGDRPPGSGRRRTLEGRSVAEDGAGKLYCPTRNDRTPGEESLPAPLRLDARGAAVPRVDRAGPKAVWRRCVDGPGTRPWRHRLLPHRCGGRTRRKTTTTLRPSQTPDRLGCREPEGPAGRVVGFRDREGHDLDGRRGVQQRVVALRRRGLRVVALAPSAGPAHIALRCRIKRPRRDGPVPFGPSQSLPSSHPGAVGPPSDSLGVSDGRPVADSYSSNRPLGAGEPPVCFLLAAH